MYIYIKGIKYYLFDLFLFIFPYFSSMQNNNKKFLAYAKTNEPDNIPPTIIGEVSDVNTDFQLVMSGVEIFCVVMLNRIGLVNTFLDPRTNRQFTENHYLN